MSKWNGIEVKFLTDDKLKEADRQLKEMAATREKRLEAKKERHKNIEFTVSQDFVNLQKEVLDEMTNRNLLWK